jgi:hypothetical protein
MNDRMDVLRQKNPLVGSQVSESNMLFTRSPMGVWKGNVEWRPCKGHGGNLSIFRRRCNKGQIQFASQDTAD